MTGHLDGDVLAEYREGLLGRHRSARIRAHLAGCSRCATVDRDLAEVSALLAAAPAPRMPDDLASRLQGVLAAESAARATAGAPAAQPDSHAEPQGSAPAGPRPAAARTPRQRRALALRVASATAVVAALAAVGFGLASSSSGPGSGSSGAASPQVAPAHGSGGINGPDSMGPAATPGRSSISLAGGTVPVLHSGQDYLHGTLTAQASAVLRRLSANTGVSSPGVTITGGTQAAGGLAGCVLRITGGVRPTLVDEARYQGQPAIVVVQAPAGGRVGQVWAAGQACSSAHPDLLAHARLAAVG